MLAETGSPGMIARCHCGRVTIRLPRRPDYVSHCNCSLCAATGFQGIYYSPAEVVIEGEFDSYVRSDLRQSYLQMQRCANCGILTHWEFIGDAPQDRMGVNARLVDPALLEGVEVRQVDGRSWDE
jgi:hypothetical protein